MIALNGNKLASGSFTRTNAFKMPGQWDVFTLHDAMHLVCERCYTFTIGCRYWIHLLACKVFPLTFF